MKWHTACISVKKSSWLIGSLNPIHIIHCDVIRTFLVYCKISASNSHPTFISTMTILAQFSFTETQLQHWLQAALYSSFHISELQAPHEQSTEALNIQFCTHCLQFHRLQIIESYKCFPGEEAHHLPHGFCHTLHGFTDLACTTKFATEDFVIWCLVQIRSFAIMFTAPCE